MGDAFKPNVWVYGSEETQGVDSDGRWWRRTYDGKTWQCLFGGITQAERKRAFALRRNVEAFTEFYKHENCGLLTLTAQDIETKSMLKENDRWIR